MIYDTIIIGAGAAGMFCARFAAQYGGKTLVIDHAKKPGEKIRISGGGRCNFTNIHTSHANFISGNPHFCKSALKRYTQFDFIGLVNSYDIAHHEKALGQLFCDGSAKQIIDMLTTEMERAGAEMRLECSITEVSKHPDGFAVQTETHGRPKTFTCKNIVVACGGKSIPKMGATGFGYQIAERFDLAVTETRPALVPLTFSENLLAETKALAGVAVNANVSTDSKTFDEALLFTHRGISGPSILQISSYWREKMKISVDLLPAVDGLQELKKLRANAGKQSVATCLTNLLPKALASYLTTDMKQNMADLSDADLDKLAARLTNWELYPVGTEGYRTAEVTLGGVNTDELSSKTMEAKTVPGLYFIGEVVDVTGWLGGYNFQWAWSSAWAAGTAISEKP